MQLQTNWKKYRRALGASLLAIAATLSVTSCSSPDTSGGESGSPAVNNNNDTCTNTITKTNLPQVTMWAWYPEFQSVVDLFNQNNNDVQICWTNAGAGGSEYDKFNTAIQAKSGAPDVIMLEDEVLNSFVIQNALVDLTQYGANDVKSSYTPGAWKDVSSGSAVYAIPVDGGPMGFLFRKDIFDKYNVPIPTTWDEFAQAAQQLRDAGYDGYICDFASNATAQLQAFYNQAGADSFTFNAANPQNLGVNINSAAAKKVQAYWNDLVQKGLVATDDAYTTDWYTKTVNDTYASYIAAAWGPGYLTGIAGASADAQWVAAPLLQWDASNPVQVNWGGSTFAVTTQSTQPALAAEAAIGIFGNMDAWTIGVEKAALFPTYTPMLTSDYFKNLQYPFFNNQEINNDVFLAAAQGYSGVTYSPFTSYYYNQLTQQTANMVQGTVSSDQALDNVQQSIVQYATQQGFTVSG